jgi:hypothetical protein
VACHPPWGPPMGSLRDVRCSQVVWRGMHNSRHLVAVAMAWNTPTKHQQWCEPVDRKLAAKGGCSCCFCCWVVPWGGPEPCSAATLPPPAARFEAGAGSPARGCKADTTSWTFGLCSLQLGSALRGGQRAMHLGSWCFAGLGTRPAKTVHQLLATHHLHDLTATVTPAPPSAAPHGS